MEYLYFVVDDVCSRPTYQNRPLLYFWKIRKDYMFGKYFLLNKKSVAIFHSVEFLYCMYKLTYYQL